MSWELSCKLTASQLPIPNGFQTIFQCSKFVYTLHVSWASYCKTSKCFAIWDEYYHNFLDYLHHWVKESGFLRDFEIFRVNHKIEGLQLMFDNCYSTCIDKNLNYSEQY